VWLISQRQHFDPLLENIPVPLNGRRKVDVDPQDMM